MANLATGSRWSLLPDELQELILQHRAALTLQCRWLRYAHFGHARRQPWPLVRTHLRALEAWQELARYPRVRREWRREPASWLESSTWDVSDILREATQGVWGAASTRLVGF